MVTLVTAAPGGWAARARKAAERKRDRLGKGHDVGPVYLLASDEDRPLIGRLDQPDLVVEAAGIQLDDAAEVGGTWSKAESWPFALPAVYHRAQVVRGGGRASLSGANRGELEGPVPQVGKR